VVTVFTRKITDDLASLVKKIDNLVGKNTDKQMRAFVVLLTEDPDADEARLTKLAEKLKIKNVPLTIFDGITGPNGYKISADADLTVLMWVDQKVRVNHTLAVGKLNKAKIKKILADAGNILK